MLRVVGNAVMLAVLFLTACRAVPEQPRTEPPASAGAVGNATPFTALDLTACLQIARKETAPAEASCPAFISDGLPEMVATCEGAGGRLAAAERPSLWSLDVNGDGSNEFLYDATENFHCDGAASVFSCGSLGCPVSLVERRADGWGTIGAMRATDVPAAEVLPPAPGQRYDVLRGGCAGNRPCDELRYYRWNGSTYQDEMIDVRGHWVDLANDGFWTLVADEAILAAPSPDATVLERHAQGTEVIVLGNARNSTYKYVSPCNACQSGFIEAAALRKTF